MSPWFMKVMETCESLSLDSPRDREILWERISEAWPREALGAALSAHLEEWLVRSGGMMRSEIVDIIEPLTTSTYAAVIAALEES